MDSSVPDIVFDEEGICNYCKLHDKLDNAFPQGQEGHQILDKIIEKIKKTGKEKYNCIIGVSGGTDSTYLVHWAIKNGLKPLAVNLDNGWHSEIAVSNIKNSLEKLNVDLITYVIEYEEIKDILLSYMKASLPWIDIPTDIAIVSTLYKIAAKNRIKYVFVGNNFRTEGRQPDEWTHGDGKQLKYIQKTFGKQKLKKFPNQTLFDLLYFGMFKGIKLIKPFYYLDYNKNEAMKLLEKEYGWTYYGGHHHESLFTKFAISYWLPKKFNIDKRRVTFSALIRSGEIKRELALQNIVLPPYDVKEMENDKNYVIKKLGINEEEFLRIWEKKNKTFNDYPSYYPFFNKIKKYSKLIYKYVLHYQPMMFFELDK